MAKKILVGDVVTLDGPIFGKTRKGFRVLSLDAVVQTIEGNIATVKVLGTDWKTVTTRQIEVSKLHKTIFIGSPDNLGTRFEKIIEVLGTTKEQIVSQAK